MFKQLMVYVQAYLRKTVMSETYFYLMVPILTTFKNYRLKSREKYIASFYLTLVTQVHEKVVPKLNERDETDY